MATRRAFLSVAALSPLANFLAVDGAPTRPEAGLRFCWYCEEDRIAAFRHVTADDFALGACPSVSIDGVRDPWAMAAAPGEQGWMARMVIETTKDADGIFSRFEPCPNGCSGGFLVEIVHGRVALI